MEKKPQPIHKITRQFSWDKQARRHSPDCFCSLFTCKEVPNAQALGTGKKNRLSVPCKLNSKLLLIYGIPRISRAVELLVLLLLGISKGKEPQNSCLVSVFFYLFSVLLYLVAQKLVALDEKKFPLHLAALPETSQTGSGQVWLWPSKVGLLFLLVSCAAEWLGSHSRSYT